MLGADLVGGLVYATENILNPSQGDLPARNDVVMSLAPKTHRHPTARELVNGGVDDTLVVSYLDHGPLNRDSGQYVSRSCNYRRGLCHAELAGKQSWESLTIVTDTTHVFRTRFLLERCFGDDYDINVIVADRGHGAREKAWHVVYENAAFVKAVWQATWRC